MSIGAQRRGIGRGAARERVAHVGLAQDALLSAAAGIPAAVAAGGHLGARAEDRVQHLVAVPQRPGVVDAEPAALRAGAAGLVVQALPQVQHRIHQLVHLDVRDHVGDLGGHTRTVEAVTRGLRPGAHQAAVHVEQHEVLAGVGARARRDAAGPGVRPDALGTAAQRSGPRCARRRG